MADDDPLRALLDKSALSNAQRAGLWDLYHAARNEDDLASRLDSMDLPKAIKADLWDLKSGRTQTAPSAAPTKLDEAIASGKATPSAGTWIDRGMAGMVWRPASGVKESDRQDVQVLGLPPELAAVGAATVGGAAARAGAGMAARAAAGAKAAASFAAPQIKYEFLKSGLHAAGLPLPIAMGAAMILSGYKRSDAVGVAQAGEAAVATQPAATIAEYEKALTPLELTRKVRDEFRALITKQAESQPKLSADEMKLGRQMIDAGMSGENALRALMAHRTLAPK